MARWLVACGAIAMLVACGSESGQGTDGPRPTKQITDDRDGGGPISSEDVPPDVVKQLEPKPWEVVSNKGETYLPNVFYADAAENEQIMPYALDGHVMIDRLVYPTIGNPNLYTKSDEKDEFMIVLRIEEAAFDHLGGALEPVPGSDLSKLVVPNDPSTGFAFFLIPREARNPNTESTTAISSGAGTSVLRVYPNEILVSPEPADMPAVLKKRKTLRFVFRRGAMAKVPAGLYDVRFEVKRDDALFKPQGSSQAIFEYQYNAVRVFDAEPEEYSVVNVTDTQVSVGDQYDSKTRDKLDELVQFVNTTKDPNVRSASFITFNGDLHNGGSPASLRQRKVAWTYHDEAKSIVSLLKYLPMPIFLTAGNHDGYVSTGHVPSAVKALDTGLGESLKEVVTQAAPKAWPSFSYDAFESYVSKTAASDLLGGIHRDIFTGGFARTAGIDDFAGWKEIPRGDRNYILYDGFYQWQKTYGPLYYSHKFGKNFYVSLNSYELRQHRRSGWGMYTVNYGGGMSDVQMTWLDRELLRASVDGSDVIVLAHQDPRGGHKGHDLGYYFEQLDYQSIFQSAINYLVGKVWNPAVCKLPPWALSRDQQDSCVHDGLQEWMRPDLDFDCGWDQRKPDFTCQSDAERFSSGVELMKRLAASGRVRTVLLGHTHYNSLEILQQGDELLPGKFPVLAGSAQKFATLEVENPLRGYAVQQRHARLLDYDVRSLRIDPIEQSFANFVQDYERSVHGWQRTLEGGTDPRELVVLRLVSNADLTSQTYSSGKDALGFSVLYLDKKSDARNVAEAQINRATFFANVGTAKFDIVGSVSIDRTTRLRPHDAQNPVEKLFDW